MKKKIELIMAVLLLCTTALISQKEAVIVAESKSNARISQNCIIIDAGHGGDDPGKIGINGCLEKDINLIIAHKLKLLLESQGYEVVMTRTTSDGLYSARAKNKKVDDMRKRCEMIEQTMPICTVSIHQNSYPEEYVKGAQVFYYGKSMEGEALAKSIQSSMISRLDPENHRVEKSNESYYLLKKTSTPTVIVECGFLTNTVEAELLNTESYQDKVAWAIMMGIVQYQNNSHNNNL